MSLLRRAALTLLPALLALAACERSLSPYEFNEAALGWTGELSEAGTALSDTLAPLVDGELVDLDAAAEIQERAESVLADARARVPELRPSGSDAAREFHRQVVAYLDVQEAVLRRMRGMVALAADDALPSHEKVTRILALHEEMNALERPAMQHLEQARAAFLERHF